MDVKEMGQRIKLCRKSLKMTREELAAKIGISPHYLYEIERGSKVVSVVILSQIVEQLQTTSDYIIFGKEPEPARDYSYSDELGNLMIEVPAEKRERLVKMVEAMLPLLAE